MIKIIVKDGQARKESRIVKIRKTSETSETSETCKIINTIWLFFKKHNGYVFLKKFIFCFVFTEDI